MATRKQKFGLLTLLVLFQITVATPLLHPTPSALLSTLVPEWKPISGKWDVGQLLTGYSAGNGWGLALSDQWFGDFEISGEIIFKRIQAGQRASVSFRHAGPSESYSLIIEPRSGQVQLEERHSGESQRLTAITSRELANAARLKFTISGSGKSVKASVWPATAAEKSALVIASDSILVPEGRLGFGVLNCEASFSIRKISGRTDSAFPVYAFRCNYRLPDKLAREPLWQYLDAVASSASARLSRRFNGKGEFETDRASSLAALKRSMGLDPWPERTPLNARTVGVLDRGDFNIEKVVFESQPGFFVNALLYVPKQLNGRAPGILSTIGHYGDSGFYIWSEQARCIGLARKGYVVLTYDPISQGERTWLGDSHDKLRRRTILTGMEVTGLMIWDSIRAIDYLMGRPEVDPGQIGVTGVSGGGFNALYTAILDDRVKAVAPAGFSTTLEALVKRGDAGCCAYLPDMGRYTDYPALYSLLAPRKLLLLGGYYDGLSDRVLEVYETAKAAYSLYGAQHDLKYFLDPDGGHTYSKPMRLALYRWFNKWLKNVDDPSQAIEMFDPEDSLISKESGLLKVFSDARPGKDVHQLLIDHAARLKAGYTRPSTPDEVSRYQANLRAQLVALMGDMEPARSPPVAADDRMTSPGSIRRVTLKTERDLPVPVSIYHPAKLETHTAVIVLVSLDQNGPQLRQIRTLASLGFVVAVPQVRGSGPTLATNMDSVALYSMALGKHLFATRIYDLQCVINYLSDQQQYRKLGFVVWGDGTREGVMALYLTAIDPRVRGAISSRSIVDYQRFITSDSLPEFDYYLPGILKHADVAEIISAIAPRRVIVHAPKDAENRPVSIEAAKSVYRSAQSVYKILGHETGFSIVSDAEFMKSLVGNSWAQ